jgi:PAS domain S-box-containing protein
MKHYDNKAKRMLVVYVFIFFLMVMGIASSGYLSYRNFEQDFRHQVEHQISAIAVLKVNELVNWRKERLGDAGILYNNPVFSAFVQRYFENSDDIEAQEQLLAWLGHYQFYDQYDRVRLLDAAGTERLSIPTTPDSFDSHLMQNANVCLRSGKVTFLDFYRDMSAGGEIHLSILVPIYTGQNNNRPLGVLVLSVDPQTYLYPYVQNWPTLSTSAETLLVRRDGEEVLFLNELRFEQGAALTLRYPLTDTKLPAVKAVLGQTGVVEGVDYRGEPVLADVRAVPDSPWFLVSKMDTVEVYAPLRTRLWQTFGIIGLAIFVAGAVVALLWRQQRIRFYRGQVEAVQALRESDARFRVIFERANDAIHISNTSDEILEVNSRMCEMMGYSRAELLNMHVTDLQAPEVRQFGHVVMNELNRHGASIFEGLNLHRSGRYIPVEISVARIERPQGNLFVSVVRDITERKQAEERLVVERNLLSTLIDNLPDRIYVKDLQGRKIISNVADWQGSSGKTMEDVLGKSDFDTYSPVLAAKFWADDKSVLDSGIPIISREEPGLDSQGNPIWVSTTKVPLRYGNGQIMGLVGIGRDITEHKQAEDEVRKLNAELEQRVRDRTVQLETTNKELEAFSYSVSHDLRAPLRGIDGWSQALLEEYNDQLDEQGQQYINRVRSETQRMGHLIDDMLKLSRLTRAEMNKEQVDLSALAQTIAERMQAAEPLRKVDFKIQAGLIAEGDSYLLEAVLVNLLGNAFKFTGKRPDARIEFGQTESQGQRVFFIRDNGAGFDMDYSQKLFGTFQRMHKVSEFPGTGIGLATVQRVIHRHGGRVWAEAEVDRGATFYFTLGPLS